MVEIKFINLKNNDTLLDKIERISNVGFLVFIFKLCHGNERCLPEWKLGEHSMRTCSTIMTFMSLYYSKIKTTV